MFTLIEDLFSVLIAGFLTGLFVRDIFYQSETAFTPQEWTEVQNAVDYALDAVAMQAATNGIFTYREWFGAPDPTGKREQLVGLTWFEMYVLLSDPQFRVLRGYRPFGGRSYPGYFTWAPVIYVTDSFFDPSAYLTIVGESQPNEIVATAAIKVGVSNQSATTKVQARNLAQTDPELAVRTVGNYRFAQGL